MSTSETISCFLYVIFGTLGSVVIYRDMRKRMRDYEKRASLTRNALLVVYTYYLVGLLCTLIIVAIGAYNLLKTFNIV